MGIFNFKLRKERQKLQVVNEKQEEKIENTPLIEIKIESEGQPPLFKNEEEIIMNGAQELLNSGIVSNLEEGVTLFASTFRGLQYKKTEHEDGKTTITLRETAYQKTL